MDVIKEVKDRIERGKCEGREREREREIVDSGE